jgi:hypothetical protein
MLLDDFMKQASEWLGSADGSAQMPRRHPPSRQHCANQGR